METTVSKITRVDDLIEVLKNRSAGKGYLDIMKAIDIPFSSFEKYFTWNDDYYTRVSLIKTNDFELLLACWEKEQKSSVHDFDSKEAWMHTIHGELTEERFRLKDGELEKVSSVKLGTTEFSYLTDPIAIHRYINSYESRTISLHLYAQPVEKWKEYDINTGESTEKAVKRDRVY